MAVKGYFFNAQMDPNTGLYDRTYNAEDVTSYLSALVGGGVIPTPSSSLQVTAAGGNMVVNVQPGQGFWTDGRKIVNTSVVPLTLAPSDVVNPRIDRVVMYCDYVERSVGLEVVTGTPASSPAAPALVRNVERYEYSLATVLVNANVTSVTQSNITDTRADSTVCGWVTGLIQQVDTSALYAQWEAAYQEFFDDTVTDIEDWEEDVKADFDEWFSHLTEELNVDTYIKEYSKSQTFTGNGSKVVTCDMGGYTYQLGDVFNVFVNGLRLLASEYTLDTSGANPTITVTFTEAGSLSNDVTVQIMQSKIGYPV